MNLVPADDILPHLAHPEDAQRVFSHVYLEALGAEGSTYTFLDPTTQKIRRLKGLTTVLQKLYWPTYTPWRTGKSGTGKPTPLKRTLQSAAQVTRTKRQRFDAPVPNLTTAATGHVRGSIMHRQMEELITLDRDAFDKRNPHGEHPWTSRLMRALLDRGLVPLQSEFKVADIAMGVATRIDLVAVNEATGRLSFLEYKTAGSRELFHVPDTNIPFERVLAANVRMTNSARSRAMLQATIGAIMAARMLALPDSFDVGVVLVTEQAIDFIDISDSFILGTAADVYCDMLKATAAAAVKKI